MSLPLLGTGWPLGELPSKAKTIPWHLNCCIENGIFFKAGGKRNCLSPAAIGGLGREGDNERKLNVHSQFGQGSEQPGVVAGGPDGTRWSLRSPLTQTSL